MLRVKILINLQVGSVRVRELRDTLCVFQRLYRRKIYLETIEGVDPVLSACLQFIEECLRDLFGPN